MIYLIFTHFYWFSSSSLRSSDPGLFQILIGTTKTKTHKLNADPNENLSLWLIFFRSNRLPLINWLIVFHLILLVHFISFPKKKNLKWTNLLTFYAQSLLFLINDRKMQINDWIAWVKVRPRSFNLFSILFKYFRSALRTQFVICIEMCFRSVNKWQNNIPIPIKINKDAWNRDLETC